MLQKMSVLIRHTFSDSQQGSTGTEGLRMASFDMNGKAGPSRGAEEFPEDLEAEAVQVLKDYFSNTFRSSQEPDPLENWCYAVHQTKSKQSKVDTLAQLWLSLSAGPERPVAHNSSKKVARFCLKLFKKCGGKHLLMLTALVIYALIGAGIFYAIERPPEIKTEQENRVRSQEVRRNLTLTLTEIIFQNCTNWTDCSSAIAQVLDKFELSPLVDQDESVAHKFDWTFFNALFYCSTVVTTIGYGNIYCKTVAGRLVTILYALVGIPLMLSLLKDLGGAMLQLVSWGWIRVHPYGKKLKRKLQRKTAEEVSKSEELKALLQHEHQVPVWLALALVLVYMLLCAGLMLLWEPNWDYFKAFYFVFISTSTIGFGDVVPDYPQRSMAAFLLFFIGLTLVSMFLNTMQRKIQARYMAAMRVMELAYKDPRLLESREKSSTGRRVQSTPARCLDMEGVLHRMDSLSSVRDKSNEV